MAEVNGTPAPKRDDGGPAFPGQQQRDPVSGLWNQTWEPGASVRDLYAMSVAGPLAVCVNYIDPVGAKHLWKPDAVARRAFDIADAMIAERVKR